MNKKEVGNNIYNLVGKCNITMEDLAYELGLKSPRVIYNWFNGEKLPKYATLYMLTSILKVSAKDILGF